MRDLRVYLDSKLKNIDLFKNAQKIVGSLSLEVIENADIDYDSKMFAIDVYADFVELAKLSDTYKKWTETEWVNFVTMMGLAFKEKGRALAVTNALTSISGIVLEDEVSIEQKVVPATIGEVVGTKVETDISFRIKQLSTPFTSRFAEVMTELLPKLLWVHDVILQGPLIDPEDPESGRKNMFGSVTIKVSEDKVYEKNIYANVMNYNECVSSVIQPTDGSRSWGVDV